MAAGEEEFKYPVLVILGVGTLIAGCLWLWWPEDPVEKFAKTFCEELVETSLAPQYEKCANYNQTVKEAIDECIDLAHAQRHSQVPGPSF